MKEQIENELKNAGINPVSYAFLVTLIEEGIETVKLFGYENWITRTTAGITVKNIVKKLTHENN
jgi:hypothetical protein